MLSSGDASIQHLITSAPAYETVLQELVELLPHWLGKDPHGQ